MKCKAWWAWWVLALMGCGPSIESNAWDGGPSDADAGVGIDVEAVPPDVRVAIDEGPSDRDAGASTDRSSASDQDTTPIATPDNGPGICSAGNPAGQCPPGQACMRGLCVSPCSRSAPGGYCPSGQQCISGACCSAPCESACCTSGTFCVGPINGSGRCVAHCRVSSDCTTAGSWCAAIGDDDGYCVPPGAAVGNPRRCTNDADCPSTQACTPTVGSDGLPRRPFVCTEPACAPYRQCRGVFGSCPNGYCNLCGSSGRCYCAQVCTSDAMCGGSAACIVFGTSRGSCPSSQTACAAR